MRLRTIAARKNVVTARAAAEVSKRQRRWRPQGNEEQNAKAYAQYDAKTYAPYLDLVSHHFTFLKFVKSAH